MQHQQYRFVQYSVTIVVLFTLSLLAACSDDSQGNVVGISSPAKTTQEPLADPGSGNLAGRVVGTVYGAPLSGVKVSTGAVSTVTADDGSFRLPGVGGGNLSIKLSSNRIYTRTLSVHTTTDGRSLTLNAIENFSNFNLKFYREIARGHHPLEGDLLPTHRWTNSTPPTFYINTNAEAALDRTIDQQTIETTQKVLRQIVPVFSGGLYRAVNIETRHFPLNIKADQIPDNSFVISFDDSLKLAGAYGLTSTDPDILSASTSSINKALIFVLDSEQYYKAGDASKIAFEEIIAHEAGHGFGFRHTTDPSKGGLPSVMLKFGEYGGIYSSEDQTHMKIVYSRPAGSVDIDNDPGTGGSSRSVARHPRVFIDRRAETPHSTRARRHLDRIQGFDIVKDLLSSGYAK